MQKIGLAVWALILLFILCSCSQNVASNDDGIANVTTATETELPSYRKVTADGMLEYEVNKGEVTILAVLVDIDNIVIPEEIDGYPVTVIGESAFYQKCMCQYVKLPQTLRIIENGAFYRCYNLKEIDIPAGVQHIACGAFFRASRLERINVQSGNTAYCDLDGVLFTVDMLTLVTYPEGRLTEEYSIPEGVTSIDDNAFGYAPLIKKIKIPRSVVLFPDTQIAALYEEITIVVCENSEAEKYAIKWGVQFEISD